MTTKKARISSPPASSRRGPDSGLRRGDGRGHLDPAYATELRQLAGNSRAGDAAPFFGGTFTEDLFAEQLGEQAVAVATSGDDRLLDAFDVNAPEDTVSPFRLVDDGFEEDEE